MTQRAAPGRAPGTAPSDLRVRTFTTADGREYAVLRFSLERGGVASLSDAENEVMEMILAGFSNAAIAATRHVKKRTVATQIQSVYAKLGVSSRAELIGRSLNASVAATRSKKGGT